MTSPSTEARNLFDQCREPILRLAARITGNAADAEEVLQETFLRLQQHLPYLDMTHNMAGWLFKTATHLAIRFRQRRTIGLPNPQDVAARPPESLWWDPDQVRRAIEALPGPQRDLLRRRFTEGLSPAEIARRLGVPPGTIRVRIFRALEELRKQLGKSG